MMTVVTGGSGSGKSAYAEQEIVRLGERERIYIATMKPWDEECRRRIDRHRAMRGEKRFQTVEWYRELDTLSFPSGGEKRAILLECVSNLVSNELFGTGAADGPQMMTAGYGDAVFARTARGILHLKEQAADLVVVTNEVFSDGDYVKSGYAGWFLKSAEDNGGDGFTGAAAESLVDWADATAFYLKVLGAVNRFLGRTADRVIEVSAGIPITIKEPV